jgi:predicted aminopeptidase
MDQEVFSGFINRMCGDLETLFASDISREEKIQQREKVYAVYQAEYAKLPMKTGTFDYFPETELNNAKILGLRRYKRDLHLFRELFMMYGKDMGKLIEDLRTWAIYCTETRKGEIDIFDYMELVVGQHNS